MTTAAEQFIERATDSPDVPRLSMKTLEALGALYSVMLEEETDGVTHVEVHGAHIAVTEVAYPNARVGVDAAGNLVSVDFDEAVFTE